MMSKQFAERTLKATDAGIADAFAVSDNADLISFAGGFPDAGLFPNAEMGDAFKEAFGNTQNLLQYHGDRGYQPLREQLAQHLSNDGTPTQPDDIILTQGAQ